MTEKKVLYCSIPGVSRILSCSTQGNHDSPLASATFEVKDNSLTLGDEITIDMGYADNHKQLFRGYVKQIEQRIKDNTYTITAYDNMVRAQDFYIASSNPDTPLTKQNISAEDLVRDLLEMAGITSFDYTTTYFTFGTNGPFEINLTSVYDYIKTIADALTWNLWVSADGTVNFKNRKPFVMTGDSGQPGDTPDSPTGFVLTTDNAVDITYTISERSLRNRVVVYGASGVHGEATASSPYLPSGFYKSSVLAFPDLVTDNSLAQQIADYNLDLQNHITAMVSATLLGNPDIEPRTVIEVNLPVLGLSGYWYVYGVDHSWSSSGYITNVELRRKV